MEEKIQKAKKDIKCFILLRDEEYKIPYPNTNINSELKIKILKNSGINYGGFSSYKYISELEKFIEYLGGNTTNLTIKEAVIPKDSDYILETFGYSFPVHKEHMKLAGFISNRIKIKE